MWFDGGVVHYHDVMSQTVYGVYQSTKSRLSRKYGDYCSAKYRYDCESEYLARHMTF